MKKRKRTFLKTLLLVWIKSERWYQDPRHIDMLILREQMAHKIGWI